MALFQSNIALQFMLSSPTEALLQGVGLGEQTLTDNELFDETFEDGDTVFVADQQGDEQDYAGTINLNGTDFLVSEGDGTLTLYAAVPDPFSFGAPEIFDPADIDPAPLVTEAEVATPDDALDTAFEILQEGIDAGNVAAAIPPAAGLVAAAVLLAVNVRRDVVEEVADLVEDVAEFVVNENPFFDLGGDMPDNPLIDMFGTSARPGFQDFGGFSDFPFV